MLRGPQGISQRMGELRAKMEARLGPLDYGGEDFQNTVKGNVKNNNMDGVPPVMPLGSGYSIGAGKAFDKEALKGIAANVATNFGIPVGLFQALIQAESSFNPMSVSEKGALGLTQLMPATARGLGVTDPFDPQQNLEGGARYFSSLLQKYHGDVKLALAAYNAGPNAVGYPGRIPNIAETRDYVNKVTSQAGLFKNP